MSHQSSDAPKDQSSNWDPGKVHFQLFRLTVDRGRFRASRLMSRIVSPRRIVASGLAILFVALYLFGGVFILSTRAPASPGRLQLWLSGGMVLYAVYHALKCAWATEKRSLSLSAAETHWLRCAPVRRSSIAVYQVTDLILATLAKTCLLSIVLAVDVRFPILLGIGIFSALLLLEISRLTVVRFADSLGVAGRRMFRIATTCIAAVVVFQVLARVIAVVPMGETTPTYIVQTFAAVGETAASDAVQWMALPWTAAARLAATSSIDVTTFFYLSVATLMLPLSIEIYVRTDRACLAREHQREQQRAVQLRTNGTSKSSERSSLSFDHQPAAWFNPASWSRLLAWIDPDAQSVASRVSVSVLRYRGTIFFSLLVPTLLCLSPLISGRVIHQWLFVVGGIGMCTSLIAPAALRLDFRRDLSRLSLLRSLPIRPRSMVMGQLMFPVLITCLFQWVVLAVASWVLQPGWFQVLLWTGMLAALSVFTFAIENALFLTYPHHERANGIGMILRTKLTFLGKESLLLIAVLLLAVWANVCRHHLDPRLADLAILLGAQVVTWSLAVAAFASVTWCWRRFDISGDMAPQ